MCTVFCCSACCTCTSFFGAAYLLIIGILLDTQGLYTAPSLAAEGSLNDASKNTFIAAVIYVITFVISVSTVIWQSRKRAVAGTMGAFMDDGHFLELSPEPWARPPVYRDPSGAIDATDTIEERDEIASETSHLHQEPPNLL